MQSTRLCTIAGCAKRHKGHGFCSTHLTRWRKHGDPFKKDKPGVPAKEPAKCSVTGCEQHFYGKGFCRLHWRRSSQGVPLEGNTPTHRFMAQLIKTETCWEWAGAKSPNGYGVFYLNGRQHYAHRAALILLNGADLDGQMVDHSCWNRACVNPEHLRLVTTRQNNENRSAKAVIATSGHRGVSWDKSRRKWSARVKSNGKIHHFGRFDNIEDAVNAAIKGRAKLFTNYVEHDTISAPVGGLAAVNTKRGKYAAD